VSRAATGRGALSSTLLFCTSCGLLLLAWLMANPPGRAPDEPMHYVKAAALANGELLGAPTPLTHAGYAETQWQWARRQIRMFTLPASISLLPVVPCPIFDSRVAAGCQRGWPAAASPQEPSYVGTYQPYSYAPSAALMRWAPSPRWAYYLGRAGAAVFSLALLVLGVRALWAGAPRPASVVGVLLALTPATLFLASTLNVSGVEIVAGFCFTCGVLSLGRRSLGGAPGRWRAWAAIAIAGVALAATRSLGPYFVVALAACLLADAAGPGVLQAVRANRRTAFLIAAAIGAAAVLNLWWEHAYQPHLEVHVGALVRHPTFAGVPHIAEQLVAGLGWLEFRLPLAVYVAWGVFTLALLIGAIAVGRWRERAALVMLVGANLILLVALHTVLGRQIRFDLQGRDLLPLAVAIPLLGSEVLRRHWSPASDRQTWALLLPLGVAVALIQALAWYFNARRHAVGTRGPVWFFSRSAWSPPGGWELWAAVVAVASLVMGAAVVTALIASRRRDDRPVLAPVRPVVDALEGIA
jgi:hypothetical protein